MLTWDFSQTALMRSDDLVRAPTEAEMFVLLVAMFLDEGVAYTELHRRPLVLTEHNREHIAEIVEWCLSPLAHDIGTGRKLRERLQGLEGAAVMLLPRAVNNGGVEPNEPWEPSR